MGRSPSLNSSGATSQLDNYEDAQTMQIKNLAKESVKSRIFLGRYIERRLVDEQIGYRDIVIVSPAEVDFKRDLLVVQQKLQTIYPPPHWIGITDTSNLGFNTDGLCIWTEIDNEPFGPFWFQIKTLKFRESEIMVSLKCLRHITEAFLEMEPILTGAVRKSKGMSMATTDTLTAINEGYADIVETLKSVATVGNLIECFKFIFALVVALITGSTSFVYFLGNFILALLRETSLLVKSSTPMFLGLLDFFSKIVGGFYILLAMIFKQSTPVPSNKRSIGYYDRPHTSNVHYNNGQID